MIVGRRVDDSTRQPTTSISTDQRRLIEYWKIRVKLSRDYEKVSAQKLSEAFQAANADQEALEFWREARKVSPRIASDIYVMNKDYNGLYEWCKSRCQERYYGTWWQLRELQKHASDSGQNSKWDLIKISKAILARNPCYVLPAEVMVEESKALTQVGDRIKILRSGLELLRSERILWSDDNPRKVIVEELELLWSQGDEENAVTFWKVMVRKMPNSWYVGRALQNAFGRRGEYPEAVDFWKRIKRSQASYQSDYFYAESCQETGDLGEAIKFWFIWMEFLINESYGKEWPIVQAAESLQKALLFKHEPREVIQSWQRSLGRSCPPSRNLPDIRQEYIASTYSNAPELKSHPDSDEIIRTVAALCAYDDRIAASLRADLEIRGIPEYEEGFWKSLKDRPHTPGLLPWYVFRLAEFYSLRQEFALARDACITAFRIGDEGEDWDSVEDWCGLDDLCSAIIELDLGCDSREFWLQAVENVPNSRNTIMLEAVCRSQMQFLAVEMWQSLIRQYPTRDYFSEALERAFMAQPEPEIWSVSRQIQFWKDCLRSLPGYTFGDSNLASALEARREELGLPISASSFDEEIETWLEILRVTIDEECFGSIVNLLRRALDKKANAVEYSDLQTSVQICKEEADIWSLLISDHAPSNTSIRTQCQEYWEDALAMLKVLERAD